MHGTKVSFLMTSQFDFFVASTRRIGFDSPIFTCVLVQIVVEALTTQSEMEVSQLLLSRMASAHPNPTTATSSTDSSLRRPSANDGVEHSWFNSIVRALNAEFHSMSAIDPQRCRQV